MSKITKLYQLSKTDCFRASLACLLGLDSPEEVPDFIEKNKSDYVEESKFYLEINCAKTLLRSYFEIGTDPAIIMSMMARSNPNCIYILIAAGGKGGVPHAFICRNDQVIHDVSGRGYKPSILQGDLYPMVLFLVETEGLVYAGKIAEPASSSVFLLKERESEAA